MWETYETHQHKVFLFEGSSQKGDIQIKDCPTDKMIADFFTKPLQGGLFKKMKVVMLGHDSLEDFLDASSTTKERVGTNDKGVDSPKRDGRTKGIGTQKEWKAATTHSQP